MYRKLLLPGLACAGNCSLPLQPLPAHCCRLFVAGAGWVKDRKEDHDRHRLLIEEQYVSTSQETALQLHA